VGRDFGVQVTAFYPIPRAAKPMRGYVVEADAADPRTADGTTNPLASTPRSPAGSFTSNGATPH
jgi:hypothetical protein